MFVNFEIFVNDVCSRWSKQGSGTDSETEGDEVQRPVLLHHPPPRLVIKIKIGHDRSKINPDRSMISLDRIFILMFGTKFFSDT